MKEKDSTPSFQEISFSLVSTELYTTIQSEENPTKDYWDNMVTAKKQFGKGRSTISLKLKMSHQKKNGVSKKRVECNKIPKKLIQ